MKKLFRISTVPMSLNILLKGQLRYLNQFYDVTAISGAGKDMDEVVEREGVNAKIIEMQRKISPFNDFVSLLKLYFYFKKEKPDIIHSITPKAGLLSMIAGKMAGVPVRMHTFTGLVFPYKKGLIQKLLIAMDKILCYCATDIYPEGKGVKNDLVKFKITKKNLKIIGNGNVNGIDLDYFNPQHFSASQTSLLKQQLGILESDFVFVFVGRLVKDKGINELVKVFFHMNAQYSNLKLLLVGSFEPVLDPLFSETLSMIQDDPNIITVGFQPDVRPYFAISNCLVFPSYREGFPNVVLQAGAMEIPSIVTNISGCNEIIENGINGVIVEPRNEKSLELAMGKVFSDKEYAEKLKFRSRYLISSRYNQFDLWQLLKYEYDNYI